jgi:hypothetical protein
MHDKGYWARRGIAPSFDCLLKSLQEAPSAYGSILDFFNTFTSIAKRLACYLHETSLIMN